MLSGLPGSSFLFGDINRHTYHHHPLNNNVSYQFSLVAFCRVCSHFRSTSQYSFPSSNIFQRKRSSYLYSPFFQSHNFGALSLCSCALLTSDWRENQAFHLPKSRFIQIIVSVGVPTIRWVQWPLIKIVPMLARSSINAIFCQYVAQYPFWCWLASLK